MEEGEGERDTERKRKGRKKGGRERRERGREGGRERKRETPAFPRQTSRRRRPDFGTAGCGAAWRRAARAAPRYFPDAGGRCRKNVQRAAVGRAETRPARAAFLSGGTLKSRTLSPALPRFLNSSFLHPFLSLSFPRCARVFVACSTAMVGGPGFT